MACEGENVDGALVGDYTGSAEGFDVGRWGDGARSLREGIRLRVESPSALSDLGMKRRLFEGCALKPIAVDNAGKPDTEASRGANMEVYVFDPDGLFEVLCEWWRLLHHGTLLDQTFVDGAICKFAGDVAKAYVFKVGNTRDYIVRLGEKVEVFPRALMQDAFRPLGYPIKNGEERVEMLAHEVSSLNLWGGNEGEFPVTGDCLIAKFFEFLRDLGDRSGDPGGQEVEIDRSQCAGFVLPDEAEFGRRVEGFRERRVLDEGSPRLGGTKRETEEAYNEYVRANEQNRQFDPNFLRRYFEEIVNMVVTYGVWDIIRWATKYNRHPDLTYPQFEAIVRACYERDGKTSFIYPEQTTFGYDPRLSRDEWSRIIEGNEACAREVAGYFTQNLSESGSLREFFDDDDVIYEFCYRVLEHYHAIPEYETSPARSVLSLTMAKFMVKALYFYFLNPESSRRYDFEKDPCIAEIFENVPSDWLPVLHSIMDKALKNYERLRHSGEGHQFQRFEKTQVKTQRRLDYCDENCTRVLAGPMSIAGFMRDKDRFSEVYPDVPADKQDEILKDIFSKLVVYYTQVCRFYDETGWVPDKRPDNVAKYVFLFGEWAMQTQNLQVTVFETRGGGFRVDVVNVDPEDHFADLSRFDEDDRIGLAKGGFNLVSALASGSLRKAVLRMVAEVERLDGVEGEKTRWPLYRKAEEYVSGFVRDRVELARGLSEFVGVSLADGVRHVRGRVTKGVWRVFGG